MKSDLVVREQRPYELTDKQVAIIANTEFVPKEKRGKHDVIWASIFHGRSLGLDDMTAIQKIHIINGVPALAAIVASGIAAQRGHKIDGEMSPTSATARGTRGDNGAAMEVTFTIEDAKTAGLAGKQVYKQHPQSMLWARAVTQLCRSLFPDCFIGGVYTREELGEDVVDDEDVIDVKGEEIHEPIPDEADNGLTEPEQRDRVKPEAEGIPQDGRTGASDTPPPSGSVSPLDLLIATYGRDAVWGAYKAVFPDKEYSPPTKAEVELLADHLAGAGVGA